MFKIKNVETGEFFSPDKRKKWGEHGKFYRTLGHCRSAFRQLMKQYGLNRSQLQIIEYEVVEKRVLSKD